MVAQELAGARRDHGRPCGVVLDGNPGFVVAMRPPEPQRTGLHHEAKARYFVNVKPTEAGRRLRLIDPVPGVPCAVGDDLGPPKQVALGVGDTQVMQHLGGVLVLDAFGDGL